MLPERRKRTIVDLVNDRDGCSVAELATEIGVSETTIRRDLRDLEERSLLERTHGGATPVISHGRPYETRRVYNVEEKRAIAERAVAEVRDTQVAFFDSGSTLIEVAKQVPEDLSMTAVTRMPAIAHELSERGHETHLTGGTYRPDGHDCVGPWTDERVRQTNADVLFLGTDGVDREGLSARDMQQSQAKRALIENAARVVLVADHSKFAESHAFRVASHDAIDLLVTDAAVPEAIREALVAAGVEVAAETHR
ncbi:DeoR family transcriptional regulator [Halarchaeum grantii]|uniref:DeoR family transcriptional regulator n=1 Tax=Halarchaeum grantii TaxID=1193105 RepID=A0A830F5E8_9EURY|nr:HTH-type transcriptional regulator GlpR [Halarchaeum grantii]GGL42539.1 DeoR family transcriptional regulator [Halarchaeum grantii]